LVDFLRRFFISHGQTANIFGIFSKVVISFSSRQTRWCNRIFEKLETHKVMIKSFVKFSSNFNNFFFLFFTTLRKHFVNFFHNTHHKIQVFDFNLVPVS
jgi:hypothetical protein